MGTGGRQLVAPAHEVVSLDIVLAAADRHVEGLDGGRVVTGPGEQLAAHRRQPVGVRHLVVEVRHRRQSGPRPVPLGQRDRGREPHRR